MLTDATTLLDRVQRHDLADRIAVAVRAEIAAHATVLDDEIEAMVGRNVPAVLRLLRDGGTWAGDDLAAVRASAARTAALGVPLGALLAALNVASEELLRVLWEIADDDERDGLLDLVARGVALGEALTAAVGAAYGQHHAAAVDPRRTLAESLARGVPDPVPLAARAGVALAANYTVVALDVAPAGDGRREHAPGVPTGPAPALLERLSALLVPDGGPPPLGTVETATSVVLVPAGADPNGWPADATALAAALVETAGPGLVAAAARRPVRSRLPEAVAEARLVLRAAVELRRPAGLYLLGAVRPGTVGTAPRPAPAPAPALLRVPPDGLTYRQVEVLAWVASGASNREIAAALSLTEATVKTHVNRIFAKTGLRRRNQALLYAQRHGIRSGGSAG